MIQTLIGSKISSDSKNDVTMDISHDWDFSGPHEKLYIMTKNADKTMDKNTNVHATYFIIGGALQERFRLFLKESLVITANASCPS